MIMKHSTYFQVFVMLASFFQNVDCYSTLVPLAGGPGRMYGRSFIGPRTTKR